MRFLTRLFLPYDLYERHTVVCRLLAEALGESSGGSCVLDVGGRAGLLERFVTFRVIAVNVDGSGHLTGSGFALPFADGSFDAVVTLDTLEHMPCDDRLPFLRECCRVARQSVIVAAPFGSEGHAALEERLYNLYQSRYGEPHAYLGEHVHYGLPDTEELDQLARGLQIAQSRRLYAGDYVRQGKQFERSILGHQQHGRLARIANFLRYVASWATFHRVRLRDQPNATTNRFYWLIAK
jgi:SAM-dependent methyltransferase